MAENKRYFDEEAALKCLDHFGRMRRLKEKPIASTSSVSSRRQADFTTKCQERLATVNWGEQEEDDEEKDVTIWETVVRIRKPKSAEEETELKLPGRKCNNSSIISFQNKLAFIGGKRDGGNSSSSVDLMDPRTGRVSPLPDMSFARGWPACAANNSHIFVFGDAYDFDPGAFTSEFYESGAKSWLPLPPMIVERCGCAAVYIPDTGVLVLGGRRRSRSPLKVTELLTFESGGGKDKWAWRRTAPMLSEFAQPLAIYFQQNVYAVNLGCKLYEMEMLCLSAGVDDCQWTSLTSFGPFKSSFKVYSMAKVDNELFILDWINDDVYAIELEADPKIQHKKLRQMKPIPLLKAGQGLITLIAQSS